MAEMTTPHRGGRDLERQALDVLTAVRDIATRLRRRRSYLQAPLSARRHAALREEILHDLDRLSNLVELAEDSLRPEFRRETHRAIMDTLHDLRDRNQGLGIGLAFEKIQELRDQAEQSASAAVHPLGRSIRLKDDFLRLVSYLRSLTSELSSGLNSDLQTSVQAINALIERDRRTPWLRSLDSGAAGADPDGLVSYIDPGEVTFPVAETPAEVPTARDTAPS
jgi:cobalamin biosynthesis Mg chelatase CobN